MALISQGRVAGLLATGDAATTTTEKGRSLEELICYVFGKVPGVAISHRNAVDQFHSEEIDVAFWNDKSRKGFYFLPDVLLVECKNWSNPVGSAAVAWFDRKVKGRGMDTGVLIAAAGITGNPQELTGSHKIISDALGEQRRLVVITRMELVALTRSEDLVALCKLKFCQLGATGSCL